MKPKSVLPVLAACVFALPAWAQTAAPSAPAAPSTITPGRDAPPADAGRLAPMTPSRPSTAGSLPDTPAAVAPANTTRRDGTRMLGAGAFNTSTGLEGAVNSGAPSLHDPKAGPRKVCPPGLENRNNLCAPPIGAVLSN